MDNWLFYPHIYRNATTNQDARGVYTYLGQYPDFSMRDASRSPYGVSSYQLSIPATESGQTISIYFPEIDIASEIWLDDTLVASNGNVKQLPSRPAYKIPSLPFPQKKHIPFMSLRQTTRIITAVCIIHAYYPPRRGYRA